MKKLMLRNRDSSFNCASIEIKNIDQLIDIITQNDDTAFKEFILEFSGEVNDGKTIWCQTGILSIETKIINHGGDPMEKMAKVLGLK